MEKLINVLLESQKRLTKGFTNFKKCGKDRLTVEYMETRKELLESDWASFKDIHAKLYTNYEIKDIEKSIGDIYDETEEIYVDYKTDIKKKLNLASVVSIKSDSTGHHTHVSNSFVKLPRIAIPQFSGKYAEWTTFHDLFTSLIHNNDKLDDVQKLHYLKTHLTGEAEQLIRHTPTADANYNKCWVILKERYNNKKYLADCILKRLFGQKRMHIESSTSLKDMLDTTNDCLNALSNLGIDVSTWDIIVLHVVTFKLDNETRKQWELSVSNDTKNELPTIKQFKMFLETRFRALESLESKKGMVHQVNSTGSHVHMSKAMLTTSPSNNVRCEYCSEAHKLCFCRKFVQQPIELRRKFVSQNKMCFNCLGGNHTVYSCKKLTTCRVCQRRHHSLLHLNREPENKTQVSSTDPDIGVTPIVSCLSTGKVPKPRQVLLATALIKAVSKTGELQIIRALLDQGSQACFVTEATVQFLGLKKFPIQGLVSGLGANSSTIAKSMVHLNIQSRVDSDFKLKISAYVLSKITTYLPERSISTTLDWIGVKTLCLADPGYNTPNKIDVLLGADVYSCILKTGMLKNPSGTMIAQNTSLGWILSGSVEPENNQRRNTINVMHAQVIEEDFLKKFWEIEESSYRSKKILTPEESKCEELYTTTTERDSDGRYIVRLPFREEDPRCKGGNSRAIAEKRFKALEKRLEHNKDLQEKYKQVIDEYLELGHMRPVKKGDTMQDVAVYLPHHAVVRDDKTTTKVRVVFNASEKNRNGISLNDTLMVGPTLQADLRHMVLRWRVHRIALVADVVKMYRQIRIAEQDAMFQRILWRDSPEKEIRDFELVTVTFGTASAPYQAVRSLHQIAYDEGKDCPLASDKVLNDFYMDDLMTGCQDTETGLEIYKQMTGLLGRGGFQLQKWNSNNQHITDIINTIESHNNQKQSDKPRTQTYKNQDSLNIIQENKIVQNNTEAKAIDIKLDSTIKILGLTWNRSEDTFQYSVNLPPLTTAPVTKRNIISDIARLFDPLGWLAPSVVLAKAFIQKLWLAGISWDEEITSELKTEWNTYRDELLLLTEVRIPRWLGTGSNDALELHGFSDASKTAYAAVIYLRRVDEKGNIQVSLLAAKTRVAPVKQISIPRLELCGAVLLSQLLTETAYLLNIPQDKVRAWTDSTVVLAWINSHPSRWKTFVANRTSEILTTMKSSQWFHVSTKENPADIASRGLLPSLLLKSNLWFFGPSFIKATTIIYSRSNDYQVDLESVKSHVAFVLDSSLFQKFSTLTKLVRIIAYCRRVLKQNKGYRKGYLHKEEIEAALECCIRLVQKDQFPTEYTQMKEKGNLQLKSSLLKSLCPYLDSKGILRVRGRLEKSQLNEHEKHPIILPHTSDLTRLIIADAHCKTLHGGPQLMTYYLRTAYWIIGVRSLVKQHVRKCVVCARQKATLRTQLMGSLPAVRCTPARPFLHSGVDYAGPINIRTTKGRGHKAYKGYICLFICMATRAVHLEVVSDMGTQAFLAAFRRFVSRRGHCAKLYSDNGTNFVGASKELQDLASTQPSIAEHLEGNGTEWHFMPPHSPNFGGIWEAGVKSTKHHLKRVIGTSTLTYEEMTTLLNQIEACLNSRPMSIISASDPIEPLPLTPGHFLIGEPLVNVPNNEYEHANVNNLTRWQFIQQMVQSFWKRWSQEYLSNLMSRYKWSSQLPEPKIGDVVLIKEDHLPPSRWLLGRVLEKHPGTDSITRVVTVRTKSATIKRPTSKLCILPITE